MRNTRRKKILALLLSAALAGALFAGCGDVPPSLPLPTPTPMPDPVPAPPSSAASPAAASSQPFGTLPRNETLYYNGIQWGVPSNYSPISPGGHLSFITNNQPVPRLLIYETLFMYNQLDGKLYGLLGKDYTWEGNVLTVTMNPDAKWSDGEAVTADDAVYTYEFAKKYQIIVSGIWEYIESVAKVDDTTFTITAKADAFNPKMAEYAISGVYIIPQHIWAQFEEETGYDGEKLAGLVNENPVASGPYKVYSCDSTKVSLIRDDNYWGQAPSMFGKLAAPKYIAQEIYTDNAIGDAAFKAGNVDISQNYVAQIWKMWENEGLPVETYLPEPPYYIPGTITSLVFNTTRPGLDDMVVRRAIALSLDHDMIGEKAVSGYTAPMVPSLMLPTDMEQALIDTEALKPLQWGNADAQGAQKLLDEAGWLPGPDGIRQKDGVTLTFKAECPAGWTDWMASIEVVSQSAKAIGVDIQAYYPETDAYYDNIYTGSFDLAITSYAGVGIASPWQRAQQTMSSVGVPEIGENAYYNFGRYKNERADELISLIAAESDEAKTKAYWTELNQIYLTELPAAGLLYRPLMYHQVNTSVWSGFPKMDDGSNIPPYLCADGYGIKGLYNLRAK